MISHIPSHGRYDDDDHSIDRHPYILSGNLIVPKNPIPLVIYVNGERKVIGEATLEHTSDGVFVRTTMGTEDGDEILDLIFGSTGDVDMIPEIGEDE